MRLPFRTSAICAGALLASLVEMPAWADEPDEPVRLVYRAPPSCPAEGEFLLAVRKRTSRLRAPQTGEASRRFTVEITRPTRGRLLIRDADGGEAVRAVEGENCSEVASALALAVAIAVDPTVFLLPAPAPAPVPVPPPPPPRPSPPSPRDPASNRPHREARPPKRPLFTAALAAQGVLATGVSPNTLWGAGLAATWTAPLAFEPNVRVSIDYLVGALEAVDAAEARFSRASVGLDACPTRIRFGPLSAFPCAHVTVGALHAEGRNIARATGEIRPWVAVGPAARARWVFAGDVFLELGAAAMFPLTRDRFFFQPDVTIYRSAAVGAEASISLGAEL